MPAFEAVLDDRETLNVLAFIKARWPPIGLRVGQAMLNPRPRRNAAADERGRVELPACGARRQRTAVATGAAVPATDQR